MVKLLFVGYQDQKCSYPRGKGLGGSSIFNDGFYVRGSPKDFDNWAKITKDSSWSFDQVLPYFKKSEAVNPNIQPLDKDYHGFDGVQGNDVPEDIPALVSSPILPFLCSYLTNFRQKLCFKALRNWVLT